MICHVWRYRKDLTFAHLLFTAICHAWIHLSIKLIVFLKVSFLILLRSLRVNILFKCSYTLLITSSALDECLLWCITFKTAAPQNVTEHTLHKRVSTYTQIMCHKINLSGAFGVFLSYVILSNHLLLAGVKNRNVIITKRISMQQIPMRTNFHAAPDQANRDCVL